MGNALTYSKNIVTGDRDDPSPYEVHTDFQEWDIDDESQKVEKSHVISFQVTPKKTKKKKVKEDGDEKSESDPEDSDEDESNDDVDITLCIKPKKRDPFEKIATTMTNDQRFFLSTISLASKYSSLPVESKFLVHIAHVDPKYDTLSPHIITVEKNQEGFPKDKIYNSEFSYDDAEKICGKELILEKIPSERQKKLKINNNDAINLNEKSSLLKKRNGDLGIKHNYFTNHGGYGWKVNTLIPSMLYQRREDFNKITNKDKQQYDLNIYKTKTKDVVSIHIETLRLIKSWIEKQYTSQFTYVDIYKPKKGEKKKTWKSTIELAIDDLNKKEIWKEYKKSKQPFTVHITIKIVGLLASKNVITEEHFPINISNKKNVL